MCKTLLINLIKLYQIIVKSGNTPLSIKSISCPHGQIFQIIKLIKTNNSGTVSSNKPIGLIFMARLFQTPIFIPKPTGQEAAFTELSLKYPAFLMDAHIVSRNVVPAKKIAEACDVFVIDPVTNHFVEKVYLTKPSFQKLPYAPKEPFKVEDLLSNESLRVEKLVIPTIEYQTSQNTGLIILPYLFSESPDDTKFGINLSMISDSLKYSRDKKIAKPLFAMINIGSGVLNHPRILNYIIERYDDDFDSKIQGYFIMIDQFDNKRASVEALHGLAHLVFQLLKNKKDVFVIKIGAFGEILSAIGASGFSSGLATGESFYEEGLREKATGFGRPISKWSYISELFNYVNDEAIKRTDYKCSCNPDRYLFQKGALLAPTHGYHDDTSEA